MKWPGSQLQPLLSCVHSALHNPGCSQAPFFSFSLLLTHLCLLLLACACLISCCRAVSLEAVLSPEAGLMDHNHRRRPQVNTGASSRSCAMATFS